MRTPAAELRGTKEAVRARSSCTGGEVLLGKIADGNAFVAYTREHARSKIALIGATQENHVLCHYGLAPKQPPRVHQFVRVSLPGGV